MSLLLENPRLELDGTARTFELRGRLPVVLLQAQVRAIEERGMTATEIWRGYTIGSDQAMPDHMLVVSDAEFAEPDLILRGRIEGPHPDPLGA